MAQAPLGGAHVLAVHVGRVDRLPFRTASVASAIAKRPVPDPVWATPLGLVGDEQGDRDRHGGVDKAVCAFPAEHYPELGRRLGRPLLRPAVGENLTTSGLLEDDVCIGDLVAVGSAVCQVSLPRNPCYRVGALHDNKHVPLWMEQTGHTGFYLRVTFEGSIGPGAPITLLARPFPAATVTEANRVMHHDKHDHPAIEALLAAPLGASWRRTLALRLAGAPDAKQDRRRSGPPRP